MPTKKYFTEKLKPVDIMVADSAYLGSKVNLIHALGKADVTHIKKMLDEYRAANGHGPSMIAVCLYCYGQVLQEQKRLHALKSWRNLRYVFEDADAFFPYEIEVNGKKVLASKIIRALNKKTVFEIEAILSDVRSTSDDGLPSYKKHFMKLPKWIRQIGYSILMSMPLQRKDIFGSVYFGAVKKHISIESPTYAFANHFHSFGLLVVGPFVHPETNTLHMTAHFSADHTISNGLGLTNAAVRFKYFLDNFKLP